MNLILLICYVYSVFCEDCLDFEINWRNDSRNLWAWFESVKEMKLFQCINFKSKIDTTHSKRLIEGPFHYNVTDNGILLFEGK